MLKKFILDIAEYYRRDGSKCRRDLSRLYKYGKNLWWLKNIFLILFLLDE